jgi:hypothetical protein
MTDLQVMILLVGLGSHAKVGAQAGPAGGQGSSEQILARRMHRARIVISGSFAYSAPGVTAWSGSRAR